MIKNTDLINLIGDKIFLGDGAMGTLLQDFGLSTNPVLFLREDNDFFEKIKEIHFRYLESGSSIIQTSTFSANETKLATFGINDDKDLKKINYRAALAAKEAVEKFREQTASKRAILSAGNLGPTGKLLKPFGDLSYKKAVEIFYRQTEYLASSGLVDIFLIETMMDLNEALAAIEAIQLVDKDASIVCMMTFNEKAVTLMGNKAGDSLKAMLEAGVTVAGANCSVGSDKMLEVVKKMREADETARLIFQPNAGLPKMVSGKTVYDETPEIFSENIKKYFPYCPTIIGGCCGSTPDHIAELAKLIDSSQKSY